MSLRPCFLKVKRKGREKKIALYLWVDEIKGKENWVERYIIFYWFWFCLNWAESILLKKTYHHFFNTNAGFYLSLRRYRLLLAIAHLPPPTIRRPLSTTYRYLSPTTRHLPHAAACCSTPATIYYYSPMPSVVTTYSIFIIWNNRCIK